MLQSQVADWTDEWDSGGKPTKLTGLEELVAGRQTAK